MSGYFSDSLEEIPVDKLQHFRDYSEGTLFPENDPDGDFRLDLQGKTTEGGWNLQIQANKKAKKTSVRKTAPRTWATVIVRKDSKTTPEELIGAFTTSSQTDEKAFI